MLALEGELEGFLISKQLSQDIQRWSWSFELHHFVFLMSVFCFLLSFAGNSNAYLQLRDTNMAQLSNKKQWQTSFIKQNYLTLDFYKLPAAFFRWRENEDIKLSNPYSSGIICK